MREDELLPYHRTDYGDGDYDLLVGPGGFECLLTEPEDRTWLRDGADVVRELNRMHAALREARAQGWREACEEGERECDEINAAGARMTALHFRALADRGPKS